MTVQSEPSEAKAATRTDSYASAYYEIADLLGIGARTKSPREVHQSEVMPALRKLLASRTDSPTDAVEAVARALDEKYGYGGDQNRERAQIMLAALRNSTDGATK